MLTMTHNDTCRENEEVIYWELGISRTLLGAFTAAYHQLLYAGVVWGGEGEWRMKNLGIILLSFGGKTNTTHVHVEVW